MPMTPEESEYSKAFNGAPTDEPEANPADSAAEGASESPAVAVVIADKPEADLATDPESDEPGAKDPAESMSAEETQRAKSWEGRLRKMEQELRAREAAIAEREAAAGASGDMLEAADGAEVEADAMTKTEDMATADGGMDAEPPVASPGASDLLGTIKQKAAALASDPAKLSAALAQMVDDYGEDYVVTAIAAAAPMVEHMAGNYMSEVNGNLEALANEIADAFRTNHKESILSAHEDFEELVEKPEFQAFLDGLPESEKEAAMQVAENGSARQVVKLLAQFKDSLKKQTAEKSPEDVWAEDAAEGIRSSAPLRLPTPAPASDEDEYKRAFNSL